MGFPTVFVRLTGCPLRCQYCDTAYAFTGGAVDGRWQQFWSAWPSLDARMCASPAASRWRSPTACRCSRGCAMPAIEVSLETSGAIAGGRCGSAGAARGGREDAGLRRSRPQPAGPARRPATRTTRSSSSSATAATTSGAASCCASRRCSSAAMVLFSPSHEQLPARRTGRLDPGGSPAGAACSVQLHKILWGQCGQGALNERVVSAIVLLSGGLDSATVLAIARSQGFVCHTLAVSYGQRHAVELAGGARAVSGSWARWNTGRCTWTWPASVAPRSRTRASPCRRSATMRHSGHLCAGPQHAVPGAGAGLGGSGRRAGHLHRRERRGLFRLPGLPPGIHRRLRDSWPSLATRGGVEGGFRIRAPLLSMSKAEIIRTGMGAGRGLSARRCLATRPMRAVRACGRCDSCRLRREGFMRCRGAAIPPAMPEARCRPDPVSCALCNRVVSSAGRAAGF